MTGQMIVNFSLKGNVNPFKNHLKKVLYHSEIIIVVDNVRYHRSKYPIHSALLILHSFR